VPFELAGNKNLGLQSLEEKLRTPVPKPPKKLESSSKTFDSNHNLNRVIKQILPEDQAKQQVLNQSHKP
jgi:hypothetical protein